MFTYVFMHSSKSIKKHHRIYYDVHVNKERHRVLLIENVRDAEFR